MKAAVWTEIGKIEVKEIDKPTPKKGEVLIKVMSAGLCITDLHVFKGNFAYGNPPHVLGHEIAGEVVELGDSTPNSWLSKRVVVETSVGCGECENCKKGERHFCSTGTEIGFTPHQGGYAQFLCVPYENLFEIPTNVSYDEAGIIESVICPFGALKRLKVTFGETMAVYGIGPAGLAFIQAAKVMGAGRVIAIGRNDERLERAKKFGADIVINNKTENVLDKINELTNGLGVDTVCEAVGVSQTILETFDIVKRSGRVILYGIPNDKEEVLFPVTKIITKQIEVEGVVGNPFVWKPLLNAVSNGSVNLKDMITHKFPLDKINDGFNVLEDRSSNVIKVVINPWEV